MSTEIEHLERRVELLDRELTAVRLELRALKPAPHGALTRTIRVNEPRELVQPPAPVRNPPAPAAVMAWAGGSALLVALILLLALAVSRGWIGEEARTALAALASLLLVAGGARAYERRGRTEAAVAGTAAGVAGGFATLAVATEVYALIPSALGLPLGLAWGATGAGLALRWRSTTIAVLGIAGGLLSPVLAGADVEVTQTIALLAIGYAGAAAVAAALGWTWLALLAFALVLPQWAFYVGEHETLPFVLLFGAIGAFAAARTHGFGAHLLLALNAAVTTAAGYFVLESELWLVAVAAAHLAGGLAALRRERALGVTALGIGVVVADIALADLVSGLILPLAWAASAVLFAVLARYERSAVLGLGGHLALAIGHVLTQEAPFETLGAASAAGLAATTAIAAACLVSARLSEPRHRDLLDVLGLLAVAYTTTLALKGAPLVAALAAEAAALGFLARHGDRRAEPAAVAFLLYAAAGAVLVAPPTALEAGLADAGAAILALLAIAAAAVAVSRDERGYAAGALALLYLASVLAVTWIDGQAGQLTLSALWGGTGLAALLAGVAKDHARLRTAGLTLLAVATTKVFIVDLASLDSLTRVGSFLVVGTLLLAGAFAWQRARPS